MGERRILVIGSQCEALGRLPFLPQAAQDLYAVMTDPERGACVSALAGNSLLIDPTVKDAKDAIKSVYQRAAEDEATLFIAYIGHGETAGGDFYLLPRDAENPPDADTGLLRPEPPPRPLPLHCQRPAPDAAPSASPHVPGRK